MTSEILSCFRNIAAPLADVEKRSLSANRGLIFDRYLTLWEKKQGKKWEKVQEPFNNLNTFAESFKRVDIRLVEEIHRNQTNILAAAGKGRGNERVFSVAWRLACGLGYDHPIENGFVLDHNCGVPYIPASGIKGLCRVMAGYYTAQNRIDDDWNDDVRKDIFGSLDTDADNPETFLQRGDIVFLDAYPETLPVVEVDISTVHHQKYYHSDLYQSRLFQPESDKTARQKKGETNRPEIGSPMETEDPVPVFFLTIGAGTRVVFRFFSRTRNREYVRIISRALEDGLNYIGIGAKTAAGYGRFVPAGNSFGGSSGTAPLSGAAEWVRSTVAALCDQHNVPDPRQILRGKTLAAEWMKLTDPELKAAVEKEIRNQWDQQGLNISKKVKQLYEEGAS